MRTRARALFCGCIVGRGLTRFNALAAGITYYPSKWWGIALPSYLLVTLTLAVLFYWGFNMRHTNPLDSLHAITDSFARSEERPSAAAALGDARQVPELYDLPISLVSRALHSRRVAHSAGDVDDFVGNGDEGDDDAYSDDDPGG